MSYTTNTRSLTSRTRQRKWPRTTPQPSPGFFTDIALSDPSEASLPGSEASDSFYTSHQAPTRPHSLEGNRDQDVRDAVAHMEKLVERAGELARAVAQNVVPIPNRSSSLNIQDTAMSATSPPVRKEGISQHASAILGPDGSTHRSWALAPVDVATTGPPPTGHLETPTPKDWSSLRKSGVASFSCTMTALIGILVGIYAGMVPSIQYYIVDYNHYAIMGNFWMYIGLAIPVAFLWPLPMLHGRKPYIIGSLSIATPLLFPQAIAVQDHNTPWIATWRVLVLLGRACMGFALGFAAMNSFALLTDIYGCSLVKNHEKDGKSGHDDRNYSHRVSLNLPPAVAGPRNESSPDDSISPAEHQKPGQQSEPTPSPPSLPSNQNQEQDPRLHGGGMDVWLGVWTFSFIGSIAIGFCVGAAVIENHPPVVGMHVSIALVSLIIFLAVLCPEVRYPRTSASYVVSSESSEVRHATKVFGRGQVKMHRDGSPPKNAGEEIWAGMLLVRDLLSVPGFLILALYYSWVYGQFVLIMVLLSALASRDYRLHAPRVGLCVLAIGAGSLLAFPLGTENPILTYLGLKEARPRDDAFWHFGECRFKRRVVFVTVLPVMTAAYAGVSAGPPTPLGIPILFAGCVGFFCTLAVMECNGLIMEAFDTSDHDHSMIGRARHVKGRAQGVPTNYSAFPRVCAAFAVCHAGGFMVAALSTAVGGAMTRNWGARVVAGVMAGMLVLVGGALLVVLVRWKGMVLEKTGHDGELRETKPRSSWMSGWLTRWGEGYEGRRRRMRSKRRQDE